MSEKMRAHLMSPEHHAMLRACIAKAREARGGKAPTRAGVPDGWGGKARRALRKRIIDMAEVKAAAAIDHLVENGQLKKDDAGNAVLKWAAGVVLAKNPADGESAYPIREQLAAAKMVLEFTMTKPETKQSVAVTAESFLTGLLAKSS